MIVRKRRFVLLVALAVLAVPLFGATPAGAQLCEGSPGLSAIQQYCETVPSAGGDRSPFRDRPSAGVGSGPGEGSSGGGGASPFFAPAGVAPAVFRELGDAGRVGRELAVKLRVGGADGAARLPQAGLRGEATLSGGWLAAVLVWMRSLGTMGGVIAAALALTGLTLIAIGVRRKVDAAQAASTADA